MRGRSSAIWSALVKQHRTAMPVRVENCDSQGLG